MLNWLSNFRKRRQQNKARQRNIVNGRFIWSFIGADICKECGVKLKVFCDGAELRLVSSFDHKKGWARVHSGGGVVDEFNEWVMETVRGNITYEIEYD